MKSFRTLTLLAGVCLLLIACNRESDELAVVEENTNPLLAFVPASTAYVYATLEPVPAEITNAYAQRFQPVLDVISNKIGEFQAAYAAGDYEGQEHARLAQAVLNQLGGELNAENLEKLGISMQAQQVVYAMGMFPVMRIGLSDSQALRAAIERIEVEMNYEIPEKDFNGTPYWGITDTGEPVGFYMAILDGQLALSVFPVSAEDTMLGAFLGQDMPIDSMASSNALAILNQQKGYTPYGSGILDMQKLVNEVLDPASTTNVHLGSFTNFDPTKLEGNCVAEINSFVSTVPRMTAGTTRFDANEIGMRYELEFESSLAAGLLELVSDVPVADEGDYPFSASVALKVGKLRSYILEKANTIAANPFQCEALQDLNQEASKLVSQLNVPMPPMINNLLGLRVRLDEFDPMASVPEGKGVIALHVDKPEMFVGMASMMVPGFDNLDFTNQAEPVRIPPELIPMQDLEVFATMGEQVIGVAVGELYAAELESFLDASPRNDGTFLSISYDMAKQMEIQEALSRKLSLDIGHHDSAEDEFTEAVRSSYSAMLSQSRVELKFTNDGMVIDSKLSFK